MKHFYTFLVAILFTSLGFGQVFITELADPDNSTGARYVELYNAGGTSVDLSTWALRRWTNANTAPQSDVSLTGSIPAGGFYIICANQTTFTSTYGFAADQNIGTGGAADSNGDDNIALIDNTGTIVDIFGVPGEDGSNTCHEFEDGRAERAAGVTSGNATWNEAEWNVWADTTVSGCTNHTNLAQSAPDDYDPGVWIGTISGPTVGFDSSSSTENETTGTFSVNIPVTLSDFSTNVDLSVSINGSSSAEGGDYTLNTTALNFTGNGTLNISLDINTDADSDDETIILDIAETSATGITITSSQHTVTVIDKDLPSVSIPYNEDFSDCGTQEWTVATVGADLEWTCGSGYFEANAFGSSGAADDYLISPSFDLDAQTGEILSFNSSTAFADVTSPQIELLYTTNYTGDPSTTTWIDTLSPTWPANDSSANSGNIDISGISGTTVHFAFRYTSTGTGSGTTEQWRIEDFDITTASTPNITLSEITLSGFDYEDGSGPSAEQTFTAEGSSLTTDITITAPTDFEVSTTSGSGFGSSVTLTETGGTVTTTTIYVRLASGLAVNSYSGTLSATSTGATQQDISLSGTVTFVSCAGTSTTFPFTGVSGSTNLEHDSGSNLPGTNGEDCGTNYLIYYDSEPSTDGSGNYLRSNTVDGLIESADWGGEGKFETFAIDVSGETSVNVETFGSTVGSGFNAGSEQFQWWYKLDGGAETNLGSAFVNPYTGSLAVGPTTIDVTGVNEIIVGFTFNMNGGSDGFEDVDVTVTTVPVVYSFNGSWSPSDPNGSATAGDDIVIVSGDAVISTNTDINTVTVNPGASLTINTGVTLTATSTTLESVSTSYSSLILDGSITGTVTYNRSVNSFTNDATNNDNDLISAPVTGQTFGSFDSANANLLASGSTRAFAPFNNITGVYENYDATTNAVTTLDAAAGYRAATTDGGTLSFTGNAEGGNISKNITIGDDITYGVWNLIGNPYPSYLDVETFLTHVVSTQTSSERNIDLMESASGIYGFDGDASDGWKIITLANASGELIAPGQGFFVAADGDDVLAHDIEFTPAMRTSGNADDFIANRTSNPLTFVKLRASTASHSYNTEFYFNDNATLGLDPGYDAVIWGGVAPSTFALYSHLIQDNTGMPIALQALGSGDISDVTIPLGLNANASETLTISISEMNIPASVNVYLEDYENNTYTLLNNTNFVTTPSNNLIGTGRFYLRFSNSALSTTNAVFEGVSIYTNQSNKTINIAGQLTEGTFANVYDIQGRLVSSKKLISNTASQTIDVSNLTTGIYIVKLTNGNSIKTEKVILK